jgi:EpsI family protein
MTVRASSDARRLLLLSALFVVCLALLRQVRVEGQPPAHAPLGQFPIQFDGWHGREQPAFDARTLRILGADAYMSRLYRRESSPPVDLYVGYYASQRFGDTIHLPLNCLPGSGWEPIDTARLTLSTPAGTAEVNRLVVQHEAARYLVVYWYQGRGRIVASEYGSRLFMAVDAVKRHRTDAALVRLMTPLAGDEPTSTAVTWLSDFARAIVPMLDPFVPV